VRPSQVLHLTGPALPFFALHAHDGRPGNLSFPFAIKYLTLLNE
jgi:hypothetical protein